MRIATQLLFPDVALFIRLRWLRVSALYRLDLLCMSFNAKLVKLIIISRLTIVSRKAKEEVPCDGLWMNARKYFTRTNLVKIKSAITYEPLMLALHYSR